MSLEQSNEDFNESPSGDGQPNSDTAPSAATIRQDRFKIFLKRADQVAITGILVLCAALFIIYLILENHRRGGLVEIEEAQPRQFQYEVDINRAEWTEIANLPGVGEVLAKRIVEYREAEGPFHDLQSIGEVRGIGPMKLDKIKQYLPHRPDGTLLVSQQ